MIQFQEVSPSYIFAPACRNSNLSCWQVTCVVDSCCFKPHFTSTLVVTSQESNACSVFTLQGCLHVTCVRLGPWPRDHLNAKDAGIEKALLSCDVTTKVLVKWDLLFYPETLHQSNALICVSSAKCLCVALVCVVHAHMISWMCTTWTWHLRLDVNS